MAGKPVRQSCAFVLAASSVRWNRWLVCGKLRRARTEPEQFIRDMNGGLRYESKQQLPEHHEPVDGRG